MPISISAAQQKALGSGLFDDIGEGKESLPITKTVFEQYGIEFLTNLGISANKKGGCNR